MTLGPMAAANFLVKLGLVYPPDAALVDLHSEPDYNMSRSLTEGAVATQVDTRDESSDEDEALLRRVSLSYST